MPKIKRNALNRGTAVYLGGSRVRFIWPCGCKRSETVDAAADVTCKLVEYWRGNGVTLRQCRRHPDWYSKDSQVARLNAENPNNIAS